jgi:2-polyprenyl-3-methyl-5-hydroxy-6-metoxy-1,4-benzoquinol methylase
MNLSIDPSQIFIRNWEIYQKIIHENYMKHKQLGERVQHYLAELSHQTPLNMLDIGCGDAKQIAGQLKELPVNTYTGYDLSAQAIDFAKQHITSPIKAKFNIGRMEELIKDDEDTYNLIYSSFAIHHLIDEQKQTIINDCFSKLEQKGMFILIDIKRLPGQSINDYQLSYADWIKRDWHALTEEEQIAIIDHLSTCDIPVETKTYTEFANQAGFILLEEFEVDTRHALLVFSKN